MVAERVKSSPKATRIKREKLEASKGTLREELEKEHDFVTTIINSIPPKAYFSSDVLEYLEEQKIKATEETVKGFSMRMKSIISIKGKQKRARFDHNQHKTVEQIEEELLTIQKAKKIKILPKKESMNIEKLHQVLKRKIEELSSVRNNTEIKKRRKNKLDKRQSTKKKKDFVKQIFSEKKSPNSDGLKVKPVFNKDGKMVFSKFDLADGAGRSETRDKKKKMDKGNKALKKSLKKVEMEKVKLEELKGRDPVKAREIGDSKLWQKVLKKAQGDKVKDDPDKIKASLKKREKMKKKSVKGWAERTENLNKKMKERQDKRQGNIKKKKQGKMDKKLKRLKKKGRILPAGF